MNNKKIIYLSLFLILALFIISSCKEEVVGRILKFDRQPCQTDNDCFNEEKGSRCIEGLCTALKIIKNPKICDPKDLKVGTSCLVCNYQGTGYIQDNSKCEEGKTCNNKGQCKIINNLNNCYDSDGGNSVFYYGFVNLTINNTSTLFKDTCFGSNVLREYYCSLSNLSVETYDTFCGSGCNFGACNKFCVDSDGYNNFNSSGYVFGVYNISGGIYNLKDYCVGSYAYDYYCSGFDPKTTNRYCQYGCVSGICASLNYTLNVSVSGVGNGFVISDPVGINCGKIGSGLNECNHPYDRDMLVMLNATSFSNLTYNSTFSYWGGDCNGNNQICILNMSTNKKVSAYFNIFINNNITTNYTNFTNNNLTNKSIYSLTVEVRNFGGTNGKGKITSDIFGINCNNFNNFSDCYEEYGNATQITLTEEPYNGSTFWAWFGPYCSGTSQTCKLNVNTNATVVALFKT